MTFELYKFLDLTATSATVLDYETTLTKLEDHTITSGEGKNYSSVGFKIKMDRYSSKYFINYYIPSMVFVFVSWVSFIIPPENVPGRMALLVTVFLVLVNIFNAINTNIASVEGLTAMETYLIVCIFFVFGALMGE